MCRKFVSDDLYLSVVNGCDRARSCVAGTTNMACPFLSTSLRHFNVNRSWRVSTWQQYTYNGARSSRDSNFESRVDGPTGMRFIWKWYHHLKLVMQNHFLGSDFHDDALLRTLPNILMRMSGDVCGATWPILRCRGVELDHLEDLKVELENYKFGFKIGWNSKNTIL